MMEAGLSDATWVAGILALCGPSMGGAIVANDSVDEFITAYGQAAGQGASLRTVPSSLAADALTGSVDLAATLALGKPVHTAGLLAQEVRLLMRRAERLDAACASLMAQALDRQSLMLIAAIDFSDDDAVMAEKLAERLPFYVEGQVDAWWTAMDISAARDVMSVADVDDKWIRDLCGAALSVGVASPRAVLQAVGAARAVAALMGQRAVTEPAVALAARLVLAHRAQHAPAQEQEPETDQPPPPPPEDSEQQADDDQTVPNPGDAEVVLAAVLAALPANLLQAMGEGFGKRGAGRTMKNAAPKKTGGQRGRRIGHKRASSLSGQRLDILATLRNAAPWQTLRRRLGGVDRMIVTRDDFRVARIKQRNEATAIFVVDASGSTAFQRLAEAKGAVETILAECYVRRDRVALVAFRSKTAEVLLPPTRSLERAKRALAGLPGGGGTPLASGLDEAFTLAVNVRRGGGSPIVILLTDGRANVTRAGEGNKVKALEEMQSAARLFAAEGFEAMLIDVSPDPQKSARVLSSAMQATYFPMPRASATDIARPVRMALKTATG
jgi:magnesium chelatase subunit D